MKKELIDIIEQITIKTGLTQGQISEKAGYKANYLAEQISKNSVSGKLLAKIKGILDTEGNLIKDATSTMVANQVEIMATNRVILSVLAEIQAPQAKRLPTELASIYRRMVKDEAEQVRSELKLR